MKYDPNSKVRSQRENMQPYQLRLPKEIVRDIQVLRVFAGVKVSEELRDLVVAYVKDRQHLIKRAAEEFIDLDESDDEAVLNAQGLLDSGDAEAREVQTVSRVKVEIGPDGKRKLVDLPMTEEDTRPRVMVKRRGKSKE